MHASLERRLLLAQQAPTLASYSSYLVAMYGFVQPLEAAFRQLPEDLRGALELERRCKAELILVDLQVLSARLGDGGVNTPPCDALPSQGTEAQALGALYVLEGSTLGARAILRHLAPLSIEGCSTYLLSYGEELGSMWQKMRAVLCGYSEQHPELDADIVAAAQDTFERLDDWFVRCGAAEVSRAA